MQLAHVLAKQCLFSEAPSRLEVFMFAKLSALVGGGPALNYNIEEAYQQAWGPWTHYAGTHKDDNSRVSVFKVFAIDPIDRVLVAARNGVKRLKMVRISVT